MVNANECLAHWEKGAGDGGREREFHTVLFSSWFICFERKIHHFHFAARRVFGMIYLLCAGVSN